MLGLAVLSYLTQRPMHAYELYRQLKENDAAKTFKLSYGALYSVVKQLLDAGFISPAGTGRTGKLPEHTMYELTDAGSVETRAWLRDLIENPPAEFPSLAAALSLVAILPVEDAVSSLRARQARNTTDAAALSEQADATIASGVHPIFLVEDRYRVAILGAESEFIDGLIEKITSAEWAALWNQQSGDPQGQERTAP